MNEKVLFSLSFSMSRHQNQSSNCDTSLTFIWEIIMDTLSELFPKEKIWKKCQTLFKRNVKKNHLKSVVSQNWNQGYVLFLDLWKTRNITWGSSFKNVASCICKQGQSRKDYASIWKLLSKRPNSEPIMPS